MEVSTTKRKLMANKLTLGSWVTIGHPNVVEVLLQSPFDWLAIDMEHSSIGYETAQVLVSTIEANGRSPLIRVGANDPLLIKKAMDIGAHGVIVPMVNSKSDALRAVESVKYPPSGKRGVGLYRAQGYGANFESYKNWLEKGSIVIVQIEHIDAVNVIEEILAVPGVDGCIIGPYDLSASLGCPGEFDRPEVKDAIERVEKACKKLKKPLGSHVIVPDAKQLEAKIKSGYTFLAFSLDFLFLGDMCKRELNELEKRGIRLRV